MPTKQRIEPDIPDHEVLRKVGGGAYGEVWMARGITGAYRAVKVVWREDFDDERSFEREFEGILKFEPISRDHPGLVNVLHVGRSKDSNSFYYYVMELGDDIRTGREINPVEYEARTILSDIRAAAGNAQSVTPCVETGIRLSEALEHLHERGLAHRDVKPANIIFVNGKAKLADIGLVANRDQRTFVGTEGFVPPEGPGSAQADVYSLGKVLYEIATGKDRLQFPEVPDALHPESDPKQWIGLNQVLCDICDPKVSKRTITSASQLAAALRRIELGKKVKAPPKVMSIALWGLLVGLTGYATYLALPYVKPSINDPRNTIITQNDILVDPSRTHQDNPEDHTETPDDDSGEETVSTSTIKYCIVNFDVEPYDAEVFSLEGQSLGSVEEYLKGQVLEVGEELNLILRKNGYEDLLIHYTAPNQADDYPPFTMKLDRPPIIGKAWWDALDMRYNPFENRHESHLVSGAKWEIYTERDSVALSKDVREIEIELKNGKRNRIVCATLASANRMAEWLTKESIKEGRLESNQEIRVMFLQDYSSPHISPDMVELGIMPFRLVAQQIPYVSVMVQTEQVDAKIFIDGILLGNTGEKYTKVKPGKRLVQISKEGYKTFSETVDFSLQSSWSPGLITLQKNDSLIWGRAWTTKRGMQFVPFTETLMASAYETRVKDYALYIAAKKRRMPRPNNNRKANEPIVHVSYQNATEYADWLTGRDRDNGLISSLHRYRLPTDKEWSLMAGLKEKEGASIAALALTNLQDYPWKGGWTINVDGSLKAQSRKAKPVGNFSDETRKKFNKNLANYFKGYTDGNSGTSAVGIYPPNVYGIHDLAGNVSEWVSDTVGQNKLHVVRGSNFKSYNQKDLKTNYRTYIRDSASSDSIGFRLVIEKLESE